MNAQLTTEKAGSSARHSLQSLDDAIMIIEAPIDRAVAALDNLPRTPAVHASPEAAPDADGPAVDLMAVLARCLGNIDLVVKVLTKFRNSGTADLDQLGCAIQSCDFCTVAEVAHRFKGAAGNVSAARLHLTASYVEQLAREQNGAELREVFDQLRAEWENFVRFAYAFAPAAGASSARPVGAKT